MPVDKYIGHRIRARRMAIGMTQKQLAAAIDLTAQQIQKYEKGENTVTCRRLCQIADALGLPEGDFFPKRDGGDANDEAIAMIDRPDIIELLRTLQPVTGKRRAELIRLIKFYAADAKKVPPSPDNGEERGQDRGRKQP